MHNQPFIDYDWSTTVNNSVVELVDSGTSGSNATMYSGQGVLFNGVDQSIDLSGTTATSMIYRIDGATVYTETPFYIINSNNVFKDIFYFNGLLTATEQTKYNTDPNGFFQDVQDGVIGNCVLNMPMDGTDGFVRDYANYNETITSNETFDVSTGGWTNWTVGDTVAIDTGDLLCNLTTGRYIKLDNSTVTGNTYRLEVEYNIVSGNKNFSAFMGTPIAYQPISDTGTVATWVLTSNGTNTVMTVADTGTIVRYKSIKITLLNGVKQIANYTTGARNTTSTLNYGSQELNFTRSGAWRGGLSSYLECNGVGYADTLYTPNGVFEVEEVTGLAGIYTHRIYSSDNSKFTNGVSNGTFVVPLTDILLDETNIEGIVVDEIRLFKVHTTAQNPTTLYNQAVARGLLGSTPNGALADGSGNIILDANGNYILTTGV